MPAAPVREAGDMKYQEVDYDLYLVRPVHSRVSRRSANALVAVVEGSSSGGQFTDVPRPIQCQKCDEEPFVVYPEDSEDPSMDGCLDPKTALYGCLMP